MAESRKPRTVYYRRKRESKTNYKKRRQLVMSFKPRLVVRRTNKHTIAQIVTFDAKGDKTLAYANSKDLEKLGFKQSGKSIPGAYLTGLLLGKRAKGVKEAIVDVGLRTPKKGSRLFACVKGVMDAGIKINAEEDIMPSEDRLTGKHINEKAAKDIEAVKGKI